MSTKRPWKVCPGYRSDNGFTFDNPGSGIPMRSYATEAAARKAAEALVTPGAPGANGYLFAVVRLWGPFDDAPNWPIGMVEEYYEGQPPRRRDLLAEASGQFDVS